MSLLTLQPTDAATCAARNSACACPCLLCHRLHLRLQNTRRRMSSGEAQTWSVHTGCSSAAGQGRHSRLVGPA